MSTFEYRTRESDGKLLFRKVGSKRIMVLDGYERRCLLSLIQRLDRSHVLEKKFALENIWQALVNRAQKEGL